MSKSKPKLIIIDGNALIHRSFHALPPTLRTKKGQLVNAVYGFSSFLLKALNEFRPDHVVLTLDKKGPTFRHEAYDKYKAHRMAAPDELYEQIPLVKQVAQAFNIPIFELSGYEADDLIGTLCEKTKKEKGLERIIITGDLDSLQLVDKKTRVYTMSRGLSDPVLYGPDEVKARYGLDPEQIIDYKALRGDASDNIPGVKGIGEKTAVELLQTFGDLDNVYKAVRKDDKRIKARILELLKQYESDAFMSQKLATIEKQAPLDFRLSDVEYSSFRLDKIMPVFSELEFKSLLVKAKELRDKMDKGKAKPVEEKNLKKDKKVSYQAISDKEFPSFIAKLKAQKAFAFNCEASSEDPLTASLVGMSFSFKAGEAFFILPDKKKLEALKTVFEDEKKKKYGHNLKFDWRLLDSHGIRLRGLACDVMIASYLLNPGNRQHDLDSLAFTELGLEKARPETGKGGQLSLILDRQPDERLPFSCQSADFIFRLSSIFLKKLEAEKLISVLQDIELPLIPVLAKAEQFGIKIDPKPLASLEREMTAKLKDLEKKIYKEAGEKFNINSTKQLKGILYEKLEIMTDNIKKTKTGFSTADDELEKLADAHPIIPLLRSYREYSKLLNTYISALPELINEKDGRIHTTYNQTIAATGRLSSTEPNLQNIPTRSEEGRRIREAFVAEKGWLLLGYDYSQIELRLAAHLSGDRRMIAAFKSGEDIHTATAAAIRQVKPEQVTKNMRREAKATNFGILYGQGPHGLSQAAGIPYAQAQDFIAKYFEAYPSVKKMVNSSISEARENGYALTMFGRKRPLPELNSNIPAVRKAAERMATNTPLQGAAADIIKLAMIEAGSLLEGHEDEARLLLQIHDELIFEVRADKIEAYAGRLKAIMQDVIKLRVPIIVDEMRGKDWGELK